MTRQRPLSIGGDRNVRVLREHNHKQFVERVTAGLVHPQDRVGKPLHVGDIVQWHPLLPPMCQIVEITVLPLEAQLPEGSTRVQVVISLEAPLVADVTAPLNILTQVKDASAEAAAADQPAPPNDSADPPQAPEDPDDPPDASN